MPRGPSVATAAPGPIPPTDDWLRPEAPMAPPPPPKPAPSNSALGWIASFLVLAALVAAAYVWRGEIMRAWPPIKPVYSALDLAD
jgi:hypothetical protein